MTSSQIEWKRLKHVTAIKGGAGFPHEEQGLLDEELPFFKVASLEGADSGGELANPDHRISRETAKRLGAHIFQPGTVVFAKVGAALLLNRFRQLGAEACLDNNMMGLEPFPEKVLPRYLMYAMGTKDLAVIANPGAVPSVNGSQIAEEVIWCPTPSEQQRIANFLDDKTARIDALIAEKERLVERLKELRDAEFGQVLTCGLHPGGNTYLTGHPAIPELPVGWKLSRLKWVCSLLRDGTHTPPPRVDVGVPLLSVRNVQNGEFTFLPDDSLISEAEYLELNRSFEVRQGDVLLAVVGATMGKVAEVREMGQPFQIQRSLAVMRPKTSEIGSTLLAAAIRAEYFQKLLWQNTGYSAQPGTYLGALENFPIPVPPPSEQLEIVAHLRRKGRDFEDLIQHTGEHITRLREYRSSLISAAVTGQLDIGSFKEPA